MSRKITVGKLTLRWHRHAKQWAKTIGYRWDRSGTRLVDADWYFGQEDAIALAKAAERVREWRELQERWPAMVADGTLGSLYPDRNLDRPFWPPAAPLAEKDVDLEEIAAWQPVDLRIKDAVNRYVEAQRKRRVMKGAKGLKQSTLNTIRATLDAALAPLPPHKTRISGLNLADVQGLVDAHYSDEDLSERTALNYARAIKAFLDWLDDEPSVTFSKPKGIDKVFRLRTPEVEPYIPAMAEVKALMHHADGDRPRLYLLLAINCGYTQVDISALRHDEIHVEGNVWFIWRRREKTSHQNTFHSLHWLFPETVALLREEMAPRRNRYGLALLNTEGEPLLQVCDGYRTHCITDAFETAKKSAGLTSTVSFKSLRKFSSNTLRAAALHDKDNMARLFLGQKIPGVLRAYVRDDFAPLSDALKAFRRTLLQAEVLTDPHPAA